MTYRVALTYHPNVGTFRNGRGAWRVAECYPGEPEPAVANYAPRKVYVAACRWYRCGTWANPLKILKEYQLTKRSST